MKEEREMFGRKYTVTLNRVYDRITIAEGGDRLDLHVDSEPGRIVAALATANKSITALVESKSTDETERRNAALAFAGAIFGTEQAKQILDFYHGDPTCVLNICSKYFNERLAHMIEKAQRQTK